MTYYYPMIGWLIRQSRPRFWGYLAGPFVIGYFAATGSLTSLWDGVFGIWLLYFLLPANLLIYGINDIADYDTDKLNTKKQKYEHMVVPKQHVRLLFCIIISIIPRLIYALGLDNRAIMIALMSFCFLGIFYSLPPIRAKAIPFLDGIFNVLYILPGIVGFLLAGATHINWILIVAATLWCMAMHAYSAIPDIQADQLAGLQTSATVLGKAGTLWYCTLLWIAAGVMSYPFLGQRSAVAVLIYMALILRSWRAKNIFTVYTYFPLINMAVGFSLFAYLLVLSLVG